MNDLQQKRGTGGNRLLVLCGEFMQEILVTCTSSGSSGSCEKWCDYGYIWTKHLKVYLDMGCKEVEYNSSIFGLN